MMVLPLRLPSILLGTLVSAILGCSASSSDSSNEAKYRITPTPDSVSPAGVYVPSNLLDAFEELDRMLTPDFRSEFAADSSQVIQHHFGLGLWMRNNWGLWGSSRLAKYFNELGICHPDDMSGIVLDSYWRRLNDRPLLVEEQVAEYRAYWRAQGAPDCSV